MISDFEKTMDGLVGDGQKILAEFVDWESFGPTCTFDELRDQLCGDAKFCFDVNNIYIFGIYFTCEEFKKDLITRTVDLEDIHSVRDPKLWKNYYQLILMSTV